MTDPAPPPPELTDELIAATMERALARLLPHRPRPDRIAALPDRVEDAEASRTADGWVRVGWLVDPDGPYPSHAWWVWLHLPTGRGRLRPWRE